MTAHIEFEHGVADPGVFTEAQGEVGSGHAKADIRVGRLFANR
jgi:hypothetical protein